MEGRVARVEATLDHVKQDVSELRMDNKDLRERMRAVEVKIDHLPGKGFIVVCTFTILGVIAGLIAYAEQIRMLLGSGGT